jgi:NAD(P)-dependent dehydrogenase (short-subunit alcohol dehydrogenase family)
VKEIVNLQDQSVLITGGASGLGLASAREALALGALVTIGDLEQSRGAEVAEELGDRAQFVATDVTVPAQVGAAVAAAAGRAPLRGLVHTAGRGGPVRVLDRDGNPGDLAAFEHIVKTNLMGSFNVVTAAAATMAKNDPVDGDRGAMVLTASVAAWEGQIGQTAYAASKAGVVGMTIVAARDLSRHQIRVNTIAPGVMDTPILGRLTDDILERLTSAVPHPRRLGRPEEFGSLACYILGNSFLNGETIRLDGAIRMGPR